MNEIAEDVVYVGVNDRQVDYFEGIYRVPNGVSYNSYVIFDGKIAVMDTVDAHFGAEWLQNVENALRGKKPDYLIVQHMEPDHSANVFAFCEAYPDAVVVGNAKTFVMLEEFFGKLPKHTLKVTDGQTLRLGDLRELKFVFAPMVHWPEVMFTYDGKSKILFTADAFGKFGALDCDEPWEDEARRYYIGIVGKYGAQVQAALKKISSLDVACVAPLHGPVIRETLGACMELYRKWSGYVPEDDGVMIAYTSVYGHTEAAVRLLKKMLHENGLRNVFLYDIIRCDRSLCVAEAFRHGKIVFATTTYNAGIFPAMGEFIDLLTERNFQNRTVGLIENGSWAPVAAKLMKAKLENCKNLAFAENSVKIRSNLNAESCAQLKALAAELSR